MSFTSSVATPVGFVVRLAGNKEGVMHLGMPLLGGAPVDELLVGTTAGESGSFSLFQRDEWLLGYAALPAGEALEASAHHAYSQLLQLTAGGKLARLWNYVPNINGSRSDGLEHYRAFCSGRSAAFESFWGANYKSRVPAASAVGTDASNLIIVFAATTHATRHVENPFQVPAYDYPREYGPRAPSFARATLVARTGGIRDVFVSGTAAIRGHATQTPGDTLGQLKCTVENLQAIGKACEVGTSMGAGQAACRVFRVYIRDAAEYPMVRSFLENQLLRPEDTVSYLRADICRQTLNVEIEATLFGARIVP